VVVKARVVHVDNAWGKKAARLHLSYLERDGVEQDESAGTLYGANGPIERSEFEQDLPGEKHQFRIILSPEDGRELDLDQFVREYLKRVEKDLGRKLNWVAVNHYNTDNPHAHLVIRGVDTKGAEVRINREYVSNGLRHRAEDLATEELGPRPEHSRIDQLKREADLERYTSLDRMLERRAVDGVFRVGLVRSADPHLEGALRKRLDVLERLGLASRKGRSKWQLAPELRPELEQMARQADGLRAIRSVLHTNANRCRVIDREEPDDSQRAELNAGVQGVVRWKGLDEQGKFCAVVETIGGLAYHLPVSGRAAGELRVGQIVELKRATDKDARIEDAASKAGGVYDLTSLPDSARPAYRARLEQLERMGLAAKDRASPDRFSVRGDLRAELEKGDQRPLWKRLALRATRQPPAKRMQQPYWQQLSLRGTPQSLEGQRHYEGYVWLDAVREENLGFSGFGQAVREAREVRHDYLRGLGLDPSDQQLRWHLRDLQRRKLEQSLAVSRQGRPVQPSDGFEGTVRLHRQPNRAAFLEIRSGEHFALIPAPRDSEALDGRQGRLHLDAKGRARVEVLERERGPER
jgi:hypothetical protein